MAGISNAKLFGKLNSVGYKSAEGATVFCKLRGNPTVEVPHFLSQVLQLQDTDLHRIIRHYNIDPARLTADITASLEKLQRGSSSGIDFSQRLLNSMRAGWMWASLLFNANQIRTGHWVVGMLKDDTLDNVLPGISKEFSKIKLDDLTDNFVKITSGSVEDNLTATDGGLSGGAAPGEASGAIAPASMGKQEALNRFTVDLTDKARKGELDPIVGRDEEIRQVVDILMRRRQ
ncbi:MAG: type VI secretion system ATPase TssH, partial [Pyrinomonadaceae bacterium]|nr:type VI secretion system ATPase TssH [Phycisphaerales bacterium]